MTRIVSMIMQLSSWFVLHIIRVSDSIQITILLQHLETIVPERESNESMEAK